MHPYPAKLLVNIPYFFLQCPQLAPKGGRLLDAFCGSGTVLVEGLLHGMSADGADSNPLARLLTRAKSTPIEEEVLRTSLRNILAAIPASASPPPAVINIDHWFLPRAIDELSRLRLAILNCTEGDARSFFEACFSACVRRASLADPRLSVPVRLNPERRSRYGANGDAVLLRYERQEQFDCFAAFAQTTEQNIKRISEFTRKVQSKHRVEIYEDSRAVGREAGFYDLVVTSPPYLGAQKYVRASGLSLGWLGLTPDQSLRQYERKSIGREHLNLNERLDELAVGVPPADAVIASICERNLLRANIASTYLREMASALNEIARVTRKGGHLVLVSGANFIAGVPFHTPSYLAILAEAAGFKMLAQLTDAIRSRGLMTKRNKTAGIIESESIFIMERV